jgi:hypothetical protein
MLDQYEYRYQVEYITNVVFLTNTLWTDRHADMTVDR